MAVRGAPNKQALDYFPKMVNFYEDDKIFDLLDEYGPLGVTIYDCILTIVYSNGYFANLSKDKLSRMVIRKIGNKWIKSQKVVVQVIDYCAELGLLCNDLMLQDIITSEGIQKRYYKIAVKLMKRQLYSKEYWLLEESKESLLSSPIKGISSEENEINSEENDHDSEEKRQKEKETKRNKKKIYSSELPGSPRQEESSLFELIMLNGNFYPVFQKEVDKYKELYPAIDVEQEFRNMIGWLDTHPKNRKSEQGMGRFINGWLSRSQDSARPDRKQSGYEGSKNRFHNFPKRDTDYDAVAMEFWQMEKNGGKGEETDGAGNSTGKPKGSGD